MRPSQRLRSHRHAVQTAVQGDRTTALRYASGGADGHGLTVSAASGRGSPSSSRSPRSRWCSRFEDRRRQDLVRRGDQCRGRLGLRVGRISTVGPPPGGAGRGRPASGAIPPAGTQTTDPAHNAPLGVHPDARGALGCGVSPRVNLPPPTPTPPFATLSITPAEKTDRTAATAGARVTW